MFKDATQTAMSGKLDEFKVRVTAVQAGQELTKEEREEWTQTQSTFFEPKKPGEKPSYEVSPQWPWGIVLPMRAVAGDPSLCLSHSAVCFVAPVCRDKVDRSAAQMRQISVSLSSYCFLDRVHSLSLGSFRARQSKASHVHMCVRLVGGRLSRSLCSGSSSGVTGRPNT